MLNHGCVFSHTWVSPHKVTQSRTLHRRQAGFSCPWDTFFIESINDWLVHWIKIYCVLLLGATLFPGIDNDAPPKPDEAKAVNREITPLDFQRFLIILCDQNLIKGRGKAGKHCQTSDKLGALLHYFCVAAKGAFGWNPSWHEYLERSPRCLMNLSPVVTNAHTLLTQVCSHA